MQYLPTEKACGPWKSDRIRTETWQLKNGVLSWLLPWTRWLLRPHSAAQRYSRSELWPWCSSRIGTRSAPALERVRVRCLPVVREWEGGWRSATSRSSHPRAALKQTFQQLVLVYNHRLNYSKHKSRQSSKVKTRVFGLRLKNRCIWYCKYYGIAFYSLNLWLLITGNGNLNRSFSFSYVVMVLGKNKRIWPL